MKVLWLTPYCPWPMDNGGKIRVWEILSRVAKSGADVDVWYPNAPRDVAPPAIRGLSWHPYKSRLGVGRATKALALMTRYPVSIRAVCNRSMARMVASAAPGYDVVVIDQSYQGPLLTSVPPSVPIVVNSQNVEHLLIAQMARSAPRLETRLVYRLDALKFRRVEERLLRRADLVLAVSHDDARLFESTVDSSRIRVRPNGVDLDSYAYEEPRPGRVHRMVMTGTLGYPPNHAAALEIQREILPLIRAQVPDAMIQIVGSRCPSDLKALHSPDTGFEVIGEVPAIEPYLRSADVFLMPLRMGGGTRLKALQAMACGLPIVSTAQGVEGIPLQAGKSVRIGESADELAAHAIELLQSAGIRLDQARAARELVARDFDWDQVAEDVIRDLRGIYSGHEESAP